MGCQVRPSTSADAIVIAIAIAIAIAIRVFITADEFHKGWVIVQS
jgi:hypothetical protein